ncbi:MAG: TrkH family potassium uptake protein [Clostridia bacterium]|nr:TrkH family potassium uptake protein [Clostridia bacterium]
MNRRMVLYTVGLIILLEGALLLLPLLVALLYGNDCTVAILLSIAVAAVLGGGAVLLARPKSKRIYAREGFAITALAWLSLSAVGALPFFLSGQIPNFADAFFETVSGFTTTGASILDPASLNTMEKGLLFWRSFTHWIGGMGVLVLLTAFLPGLSERSIHILRAEMPGPTMGKFVPKLRDTAKLLYLIYFVMTAVMFCILMISGLPAFDSAIFTFGAAGTGGFTINSAGLSALTAAQQWIITVFMLLFGVNFNLYYLMLIRRFRSTLRSTELWAYFGIFAAATALVCIDLTTVYGSFSEILRHSAFQVSSIMTTTGYSTANFDLWPNFSKAILFILMFIGGCAGSTAGGLKVSRLVLLIKNCHAQFRRTLHPRSVNVLRFEGKKVEEEVQSGVVMYFLFYIFCIFGIFFFVSLDGYDLTTSLSASVTCFNNVGPGLGAVGPAANFSLFSDAATLLLSFAMLLGRLEIWPILILLYPATWRHRGKSAIGKETK